MGNIVINSHTAYTVITITILLTMMAFIFIANAKLEKVLMANEAVSKPKRAIPAKYSFQPVFFESPTTAPSSMFFDGYDQEDIVITVQRGYDTSAEEIVVPANTRARVIIDEVGKHSLTLFAS